MSQVELAPAAAPTESTQDAAEPAIVHGSRVNDSPYPAVTC
jgi:hypothetical protein